MENITKWLLILFGALVILLNAAETALFGATYLPAAFGNPDNGIIITPVIAGEVTGSPINCNDTPENFANDLTDLIEMLNGQGAFSADTPRSPRTAGEA